MKSPHVKGLLLLAVGLTFARPFLIWHATSQVSRPIQNQSSESPTGPNVPSVPEGESEGSARRAPASVASTVDGNPTNDSSEANSLEDALTQNQNNGSVESCYDASQFECNRKIFNPEIQDGQQYSGTECVQLNSVQNKFCVELRTFTFNTKSNSDCEDCRAEDSQPGGRFNYEEYYCTSQTVQLAGDQMIHAEGGDLSNTVNSLVNDCVNHLRTRSAASEGQTLAQFQ